MEKSEIIINANEAQMLIDSIKSMIPIEENALICIQQSPAAGIGIATSLHLLRNETGKAWARNDEYTSVKIADITDYGDW